MPSTYYCTPDEVAKFLMFNQDSGGFTTSTHPTYDEVAEIINRSEDEIDRFTCTSFRRPYKQIAEWEYHNIEVRYRWFTGIAVYLRYRPAEVIFDGISSGYGGMWDGKVDAVEIWNGSSYEPLTLSNESRSNDWWVDVDQGIVYLRSYLYLRRPMGLRIKYHYGYKTVPADIKRACIYLTAADILSGEDRSVLLPEGTDNLKYADKVEMWQRRAQEILMRYREIRTVGEIF